LADLCLAQLARSEKAVSVYRDAAAAATAAAERLEKVLGASVAAATAATQHMTAEAAALTAQLEMSQRRIAELEAAAAAASADRAQLVRSLGEMESHCGGLDVRLRELTALCEATARDAWQEETAELRTRATELRRQLVAAQVGRPPLRPWPASDGTLPPTLASRVSGCASATASGADAWG
jgi:chromosome segregation ATPase